MEKYERVLKLMQDKGGRIELTDPDLLTLLDRPDGKRNLSYRISTYIYFIRKNTNLQVRSVRSGRKVVAYELTAAVPTDTPATTDVPETDEVIAPNPTATEEQTNEPAAAPAVPESNPEDEPVKQSAWQV